VAGPACVCIVAGGDADDCVCVSVSGEATQAEIFGHRLDRGGLVFDCGLVRVFKGLQAHSIAIARRR